MHRFLSCSEAAAILGVTRETARLYATSGRIEAMRTSAGWMLDATAVAEEAAVRGNSHGGKIGREGVRAIRAGIDREAFSQDRAVYWAERIAAAKSPQEARETIALIDRLAGSDGRTTAAGDGRYAGMWPQPCDDEPVAEEFQRLWAPRTRAEDERRRREEIAASAPPPDEAYDGIPWGPGPVAETE